VAPYQESWAFGDGSSATGATTSHTYLVSGHLTVTLQVTDGHGLVSQSNSSVVIAPGLWSAASGSPSPVEAGANVTFTASAGGGVGPYFTEWNFDDGYASGTLNTTHAYQSSGTYIAALTVLDSSGHASYQYVTIVVNPRTPNTTTTPVSSSGSSGTMLSDADIIALAVIGGAVIIAATILVVRRMDRNRR
jgi:PKD repeat protein